MINYFQFEYLQNHCVYIWRPIILNGPLSSEDSLAIIRPMWNKFAVKKGEEEDKNTIVVDEGFPIVEAKIGCM